MELRRVPRTLLWSLAAVLVLSGCMVGPDYRKPETATPANLKNVPRAQGQAAIDSRWWLVYADPTLNMLEDQAAQASPQLDAAVARVLQARAIARVTDADLYPDVGLIKALGGGWTPNAKITEHAHHRELDRPRA
jgi:outer membrane protein TolC